MVYGISRILSVTDSCIATALRSSDATVIPRRYFVALIMNAQAFFIWSQRYRSTQASPRSVNQRSHPFYGPPSIPVPGDGDLEEYIRVLGLERLPILERDGDPPWSAAYQ